MNPSDTSHAAQGPLKGLRVIEFAGLGPAPFACMLLSDMGAEVVTIDRPEKKLGDKTNIVGRGRQVVLADLKNPVVREQVFDLIASADVLVEGFRPGVMERLGLGPEEMMARNPRLIYGRMTGWGQTGPLAKTAGHDINFISLSGALHAIGPAGGPPVPPLNLVGDYGGGSLYLVVGILAALHETHSSGHGQVVDAAITDGTLSLMSHFVTSALRGSLSDQRGSNLLDGGAPFYGVYKTSDDRHVSVGPIEPQFFEDMCERLGLDSALRDAQHDKARWPELRNELERIFRSRTRDAWEQVFYGTDACVTPVLTLSEAHGHPQNAERDAFIEVDGVRQPAPAPRFSRTLSAVQGPSPSHASAIADLLAAWSGRAPCQNDTLEMSRPDI